MKNKKISYVFLMMACITSSGAMAALDYELAPLDAVDYSNVSKEKSQDQKIEKEQNLLQKGLGALKGIFSKAPSEISEKIDQKDKNPSIPIEMSFGPEQPAQKNSFEGIIDAADLDKENPSTPRKRGRKKKVQVEELKGSDKKIESEEPKGSGEKTEEPRQSRSKRKTTPSKISTDPNSEQSNKKTLQKKNQ